MDTKMSEKNKIDIIKPTLRRACEGFSLSSSYHKQGTPHPSAINSVWFSEDWDGNKAKAKEKNKSD